jgi:hypothetical protein
MSAVSSVGASEHAGLTRNTVMTAPPARPESLTDHDVEALTALLPALQHWACEIEIDPAGDLWAVLTPESESDGDEADLVVCRQGGQLTLLDARGRLLERLDGVDGLAGGLLARLTGERRAA